MLHFVTFQESIYPLIMLGMALFSFGLNIYLARLSNKRFKSQEMDKKLDVDDFKDYKEDHEEVHKRDRGDVTYIRGRVDEIAAHLMGTK